MVVVADVADYKAMCSGWAGLGVIYQGVTLQAVYPAHGTWGQPVEQCRWRELRPDIGHRRRRYGMGQKFGFFEAHPYDLVKLKSSFII